jgi:hypothetical protein
MWLVAEMRSQLRFEHLLKGISKQARENALLAEEIVRLLALASSCWTRSTDGIDAGGVWCFLSGMVRSLS